MGAFLDVNVLINLRKSINDTNLFNSSEEYKRNYFNLICAVMHRMETAVNYLNIHSNYPETEEDFINFLTYSDMIIEAIRVVFLNRKLLNPFDEENSSEINDSYFEFFGDVKILSPKYELYRKNGNKATNKDASSSDSKFFKYIRALALAHFCGTNRHPNFLKNDENEIQYSPFVLANNIGSLLTGIDKPVGLMVYSNLKENSFSIEFSFEKLKKFINSRYKLFELVTEHNLSLIKKFEDECKKRKVRRDVAKIQIFKEINEILKVRFVDFIDMNEYISIFEYRTDDKMNKNAVENFKIEISKYIDLICNAVDNLEHEELNTILNKTIYVRPKNKYSQIHYQLEKIFCCDDETLAKTQAKLFSKEFAKKWVNIDVEKMEIEEIRILCRVACYLEAKELEK